MTSTASSTSCGATSSSKSFGSDTTYGVYPSDTTSILDYLEAISAFVFAYQGQAIYFELMNEMKEPQQFPRSCYIAYSIMCCIYGVVVIIVYGYLGKTNTPEFLPDSLLNGTIIKQIVGFLVVLHITVSYVIACQPLHMYLHSTFFPSTYQQTSLLGSIHWFCITFGYIVIGYIVGNLIPYFADVQALIGSLFGAPIIFGWPSVFIFMLYYFSSSSAAPTIGRELREADVDEDSVIDHPTNSSSSTFGRSYKTIFQQMGYKHAIVCCIFLVICTPLFCLLGTIGAIQSIVEDTEQATTKPFQCSN